MGLTRPRAAQIYDIDYKQAVRVITTTNITLSGGAPTVVDGVTLSLNDRILVTGQSTASQNGIYYVSTLGTGANGTWTRSKDTDATGELLSGTIVMVTEGTTYADTSWKLTTNDPITIGTTALTFEINTGNAFGVISANGTSVVANSATGTVTFSTANNLIITGNAASDSITFEVSQSPNITGTLTVSGVIGSNLIPSANITYNLGNTTNRWKDIWLSNSTIYLGNAQISANATSLILTNPQGAQTVLSGTTPDISASTVTATGNITGGNLTTAGTANIGTLAVTGNETVAGTSTVTGNITGGNLKTSAVTIGSTGAISGVTTINASGNANVGNLGATNAVLAGSLTGVTTISASGNANVGNLGTAAIVATGAISGATTLSVTGNANVGNLGATNANVTAITATGNANVGNLGTAGLVVATGNVTGGNLVTAGQVTASGNITGNYLLANITFASGYNTTRLFNGTSEANIGTSGGNANITIGGVSNVAVFSTVGANITGTLGVTGNITGGNVSGTLLTGTLTTAAQPNVTSVGTLTSLTATGNVTGGNLITTGTVSTGTLTTSGNATVAGNLTVSGNVISVNVTNLNVVDPIIGIGRGANDTPLTTNDGKDRGEQLWYYTTSEQSAFIGYKNSTGKLIAATNVSVSGEVVTVNSYGNLVIGGLEATTISATGNANVGNLGTAGQVTATGNITGGNLTTSGNITGNYLLANITFASGYNTTKVFNGVSEANIGTSGGNLAISIGGTSNVMVVSSSGAAVTGTLTASGNANVGNLGTAGQITATGNITSGNVNLSGNIVDTGALFLITGASGNVTLAPNGTNVVIATTTGANITGTLNATGNANVGNLGTAGQITATGNITASGNISGGNILGNGYNLTGINTFSSIAVSGANTVVADSIADTLTLAAGAGITIVTNSTTDTITIAAASSGSDIFVDGADFGTITEAVTLSQDLGLITEVVDAQSDLGEIVTSGVFYPTQLVLPSYTVATLPSATVPAQFIYVSNESGGAVPAFSDGTNWRRVTDRAIVT